VNTYGAFGSVNEQRNEFIISAAADLDGPWREYEFKVKPGDIMRPPRFISPYHYRLDWLMWIASTVGSLPRSSSWLYPFLFKLLEQDPDVLNLLAKDPFQGESQGPKYIRVDTYRYTFHKSVPQKNKNDKMTQKSNLPQPYWNRTRIGRVFPRQGVASKETLREFLQQS
jgi:lipase maturation factor 1